jgi:peptide/nickel transport system substrate-binding protein
MQAFDYELLRPNWASPVMKDPAMRQAVAYAINKDEINTKILGGAAVPANTNVSPNAWYYDATAKMPTFDLAKANSILDTAGWVKGTDGVRVKNGVRADIKLCTTTRQSRIDTLALVASWLKQIGINATAVPVKSTQIFATWNNATDTTECNLAHGTYDIAEHAFSSPLDPLGNYAQMHSSQMEPKGSNDARINDAQIDKVMDTLKTTVDFAKIGQAMKDYQQIYVQVIPEIPLYYRKNVTLHNARVGNFTGNGTNQGPLWNVADWYIVS